MNDTTCKWHESDNLSRTWIILHVTDMNFTIFYGYEWHDILLTWMLVTFTDMNDTTCYWHECYYFYEHD